MMYESGQWSVAPTFYTYVIPCCRRSVTQSCLTLCDPMDCSPPGSSVHGISRGRIMEWVAIALSRGSNLLCTQQPGILLLKYTNQILLFLVHKPPLISPTHLGEKDYLFITDQQHLEYQISSSMGFPDSSAGKESACSAGDLGLIPGLGRFPWSKGKATHSSILAWRIPWTVHGVGHDWATFPNTLQDVYTYMCICIKYICVFYLFTSICVSMYIHTQAHMPIAEWEMFCKSYRNSKAWHFYAAVWDTLYHCKVQLATLCTSFR